MLIICRQRGRWDGQSIRGIHKDPLLLPCGSSRMLISLNLGAVENWSGALDCMWNIRAYQRKDYFLIFGGGEPQKTNKQNTFCLYLNWCKYLENSIQKVHFYFFTVDISICQIPIADVSFKGALAVKVPGNEFEVRPWKQ